MTTRYEKQLLLPEITPAHQEFLKNTKLLMVGAGGLGAAALPWLAGAGVGHITIADGDTVDISNLHRQTIFKDGDAGKNKAELAALYIRNLNPGIRVNFAAQHITEENAGFCNGFDIILDGTDNFEAKKLLNKISVATKTPLVAASVEQFSGTAGIFAGFDGDAPCYDCLFPELPLDCKTCVEAGILGTVAGLAGLWQAHLTLCFLLGIGDAGPGTVISMDFKTMRTQQLKLHKNSECALCKKPPDERKKPAMTQAEIPLLHPDELKDHVIIDVRSFEEVFAAPIENAVHIPLQSIPEQFDELPKDRPLAFVCASNIRSRRAAEYAQARGLTNVCVLDALAA